MNVLFMSLLYPDDMIAEVSKNSKDGLQNQINSYQRAFISGIKANLLDGERLEMINSLPVGVFPTHYRKLVLKSGLHGDDLLELGGLNLPWFKQHGRRRRATRAILDWAKRSPKNRTVLLYTLYLPYMQAVIEAKRTYPDLRAAIIVTDLPNELGISSGRRGILKHLEYAMGHDRVKLCAAFDGFVLLTRPMREALAIREDQKHIVIEGLIVEKQRMARPENRGERHDAQAHPAVLYTGTLNRELGIQELLEAFEGLPQYELWLCGRGDMEERIRQAAQKHPNIHYDGFVAQEEAFYLQSRAALLINPRSPGGLFTRFSFPSKTLEYMRSGKPVLCYRLDGIPPDYDPYLFYIQGEGASGIRDSVSTVLEMPSAEREIRGEAARKYVLADKNPQVQCKRMLEMLRTLGE